ncbi:hypothetical protein FHR83_002978 [Actinoplanes campanulatus]|uniref:DUF998 domain-containing protein n=1 Tax=Actinoplanes campanulatus TaxID=113559 RepID=A0A7W5AFW8_9ACTN|nr:DUF998 domain-containing protein [Actinoplanes campanulatus]MBB3095315.1 hypothetical protein [Actinoplanes campanulatus]GGN41493.1 hypothetical protein GCM10010109_71610 [Actinoplanes campanulatus]GID34919.1 hypothetical protein Aca09nite_14250 [Actinoplanes campanulatus]
MNTTLTRPRTMRRQRLTVYAGLAGYVTATGAADLINPDWSPIEAMVSHYAHADAGWLIPLALLSLATASTALLHRIISGNEPRPTPQPAETALLRTADGPRWTAGGPRWTAGGKAATTLLVVWIAALILGALFPTDPYGQWDRPPSTSGMVHGLAALLAFTSLPAAAVLFTRVWRRDPRRRPAARRLTVTAVLTVIAYLVLVLTFMDVQGSRALTFGPWESLVGLTERLTLWSYVAWLAVAAHATSHDPRR